MADDLHDTDFYAWTQAQARALRSREAGANSLDYDNLAEEVDDLGNSVRRACVSQIDNILTHLLKITLQGGDDVAHWASEIVAFRIELERDLTPTLRASLPRELDAIYLAARRRLTARWRAEGVAIDIPERSPFGWDEVLGKGADWVPDPPA
jgi:hypothetical protein